MPNPILRTLAQESLDIQNACNTCGLAQRFAEVMKRLLHHPEIKGTGAANSHPITKMWISKFEHLAGLEQSMSSEDYNIVADLAEGKETSIARTD